MATETLILRPTHVGGMSERYPSETADDQTWSLIAEEVADDDATYIIPTINTAIFFTVPDEYLSLTPTAIKIFIRAKASANATCQISLCGANADDTEFTTVYQTSASNVPSADLESVYQVLAKNITNTGHGLQILVTGNSKSTIYLTQAYLELTYGEGTDTPTSDVIYIKENSVWTAFSGEIYRKINSAWTLTDASVLQSGTKYIVQKS